MRLYETIFITRSDLSEEEHEALAAAIKEVVTSHSGEVVKEEDWGIKSLAYEVDHHQKGHYHLLQFRGDGAALDEMARNYRYNESIIKYMTIRLDEK